VDIISPSLWGYPVQQRRKKEKEEAKVFLFAGRDKNSECVLSHRMEGIRKDIRETFSIETLSRTAGLGN
jgi:hypothetical protein